jgi:hypothetical protein
MERDELFKRVNELSGKYPNLNSDEVRELRILSGDLNKELADIIFDMEVEV